VLDHSLANQWRGHAGRPHEDTQLVSDRQRALVLLALFLISTVLIVTSLHFNHPREPHPGALLSDTEVKANPHYLKHQENKMAKAAAAEMQTSSSASPYSVLYVTVPSMEVGEKIAHALLEKRLVACVNILPGVKSMYRWEGKIQSDTEHLLMLKTRSALFGEVCSCVRAEHPYEVPECIELPIQQGHKAYLEWIGGNTKELGGE
jgi:uncharacterized protein involved in tolerance to divalent cations